MQKLVVNLMDGKHVILTFHFQNLKVEVRIMGKNQYVVRHGNEWAVRGANNSKATRVVSTQREAISIASGIARNQHSEMRVQDRNGQFRVCNSYGNDSCPPRDKNY